MISAKKLATIGAAAALFVVSASPASAFFNFGNDELKIKQSNSAVVVNDVDQNANTGNQGGYFSGGNKAIKTGDASNYAEVTNVVNSNKAVFKSCGCFDDVKVKQSNHAFVKNEVDQDANTGNQSGGGHNFAFWTGEAANGAVVTSVVNSNVALSF